VCGCLGGRPGAYKNLGAEFEILNRCRGGNDGWEIADALEADLWLVEL
jgi:hypothetical protein